MDYKITKAASNILCNLSRKKTHVKSKITKLQSSTYPRYTPTPSILKKKKKKKQRKRKKLYKVCDNE